MNNQIMSAQRKIDIKECAVRHLWEEWVKHQTTVDFEKHNNQCVLQL